jgi:Rieske Fe-S protein
MREVSENEGDRVSDRRSGSVSRRSFGGLILGGGLIAFAGAALYPIIRFLIPPKIAEAPLNNVVAAKVGELKPNSGIIFKFGNKPGLLIRLPSGDYKSFSAVCTHLNCTVSMFPTRGTYGAPATTVTMT